MATGLDWFRDSVDVVDSGTAFQILTTSCRSGQLSAGAIYRQIRNKTAVVLSGRKNSYGQFYVSGSYEIGVRGRKKWKRIKGPTPSDSSCTVRVDDSNHEVLLEIDMEPFRSSIGSYRWGRVVLANGEAAELMLEDLLPTPEARDASGNFKKDITDPDSTRFGSLFALVSIVSFSSSIVGDFVFVGEQGTIAEVGGVESADGEFWPFVVLQFEDEKGKWETIGTSKKDGKSKILKLSSEGSLPRLHVLLDPFKGYEKRYRYGRLIFPDSEITAVFQISDLAPRSGIQPF